MPPQTAKPRSRKWRNQRSVADWSARPWERGAWMIYSWLRVRVQWSSEGKFMFVTARFILMQVSYADISTEYPHLQGPRMIGGFSGFWRLADTFCIWLANPDIRWFRSWPECVSAIRTTVFVILTAQHLLKICSPDLMADNWTNRIRTPWQKEAPTWARWSFQIIWSAVAIFIIVCACVFALLTLST